MTKLVLVELSALLHVTGAGIGVRQTTRLNITDMYRLRDYAGVGTQPWPRTHSLSSETAAVRTQSQRISSFRDTSALLRGSLKAEKFSEYDSEESEVE